MGAMTCILRSVDRWEIVFLEGYNYVLEYDNNSLIMYKEDIDEWMGDIENIRVFTVEGDTSKPITLYWKLTVAAQMQSFFRKYAEISNSRHFPL